MREAPMQRKTFGRIFVTEDEDIAKVDAIIKRIDEFEYGYMPGGLIVVLDRSMDIGCQLKYLHKFEVDKAKLSLECFMMGIPLLIVDGERGNDF